MSAKGSESIKDAATASSKSAAMVAMEVMGTRFFMMCGY
jgi:hypothetical protein